MTKRQLESRVLNSLLERLECYTKKNKASKTDIAIAALAQYLNSPENVPLEERMAAVESRLAQVEAQLKKIGTEN